MMMKENIFFNLHKIVWVNQMAPAYHHVRKCRYSICMLFAFKFKKRSKIRNKFEFIVFIR